MWAGGKMENEKVAPVVLVSRRDIVYREQLWRQCSWAARIARLKLLTLEFPPHAEPQVVFTALAGSRLEGEKFRLDAKEATPLAMTIIYRQAMNTVGIAY
jgi:hypothetical protein